MEGNTIHSSGGNTITKQHFIALADAIKEHNAKEAGRYFAVFNEEQLNVLATFCARTNINFNRERWLAYIAGECGPNGGTIKKATA